MKDRLLKHILIKSKETRPTHSDESWTSNRLIWLGDFGDGQNKTTRGKALDKHCTTCDKKISGANWNKHVKNVHDGVQPSFNKRNEQTLTLN